MKTGRRVATKDECEECEMPTRRGRLTKHKGKMKCPECLNGNQVPIHISVMQSNMCMWDSEPILGNDDDDKEEGLLL